ncbi:MAG TPA: hypothetical protein VG168_12150, partial [Bryobacteraceae bacterium]|nr:hypothetical protein [Bryobacteraceae bacterium]
AQSLALPQAAGTVDRKWHAYPLVSLAHAVPRRALQPPFEDLEPFPRLEIVPKLSGGSRAALDPAPRLLPRNCCHFSHQR